MANVKLQEFLQSQELEQRQKFKLDELKEKSNHINTAYDSIRDNQSEYHSKPNFLKKIKR